MNITIRLGNKNEQWEKAFKALEKKNDAHIEFVYGQGIIDLTGVDALISMGIEEEELESADQLQYFFLPFTGVNRLPLKRLNDMGVTVTNSHANANLVAEKAFALSLSLLGRIVNLHTSFKGEGWSGLNGPSTWTSLYHKKCGILGMGEIGQHLVKLLQPFNCEIVTLSRYKKRLEGNSHITYYDDVSDVCKQSDITYISLPLTDETNGLISESILNNMQNKYIVNVGRAEVVDERALYQALKEGVLKGAALDVWYQYPRKDLDTPIYPSVYPIHELEQVVLSPHCAANTIESRQKALEDTVLNVERLLRGEPLKYVVNNKRGY